MFETITETENRGQVGIGTLIVFIAMVLVAAIAAGVLINTAGTLQSQASDTGSETQEQVANQIQVTHAVGHVNPTGDVVDAVDMTIMKSAGSNEIDLESMTVQYTSDHTDKTLTWDDIDAPNGEYFATEELSGENDGTSLTTTEDRVKLSLDVGALEGGNPSVQVNDEAVLQEADLDIETETTLEEDLNGYNAVFDVVVTDTGTVGGTGTDIALELSDGSTVDTDTATLSESGTAELQLEASDISMGDSFTITNTDGPATFTTDYDAEIVSVNGLETGSSATVALVDQSGAQFTYGISVPSTFGTASIVEV